MEEVYIVSGVRTAIGKYGGSLKSVPAHTLAAAVIKEAVVRSGADPERIDEVILGEVRQSTEASNIARCALLEAGIPETVPGFTVNRLCGIQRMSGDMAGRGWLYRGGRNGEFKPRPRIYPERTLGG